MKIGTFRPEKTRYIGGFFLPVILAWIRDPCLDTLYPGMTKKLTIIVKSLTQHGNNLLTKPLDMLG